MSLALLEQYAMKLIDLETAVDPVLEEQLFDLLLVRDRVECLRKDYDAANLQNLLHLDQRLQQQGIRIAQFLNLPNCRTTVKPTEDAWWWWFEPAGDWRDRYDWLWSALCVPMMATSGALLLDLSGRFLSGGIDTFGALTVVSQSLLALLTASGTFTKSGEAGIENTLRRFHIPTYHLQEVKFLLALALLLGLFGTRSLLPNIAAGYLKQAIKAQQEKHLVLAQTYYQRALKLDPTHSQVHYYLGTLHEALQNSEEAQAAYQIAVRSGSEPAVNQLARLYLIKNQPDKAVSLLVNSIDQVQDADVKYALHKNLGWARFQQNWLTEAKTELQSAISINAKAADAHCLMAQVLSDQKHLPDAKLEWQRCLATADSRLPEHDRWIQLGRQAQESLQRTPPLANVVR